MQEIRDAARLRAVYQANQKLFQAPPPVMRLLRFEKGEFLSRPFKKLNQFLLVVEGNVRIYDIHENSSFRGVASGGPGTLLGDMEFCSAPTARFTPKPWSRCSVWRFRSPKTAPLCRMTPCSSGMC